MVSKVIEPQMIETRIDRNGRNARPAAAVSLKKTSVELFIALFPFLSLEEKEKKKWRKEIVMIFSLNERSERLSVLS